RLARPVGIRMLAVDLLEFLRGRLVVLALVHQEQALIVELVRGLIDEGVVFLGELVPKCAGAAAAKGNGERDQRRSQAQPRCVGRDPASCARYTLYRHDLKKPDASNGKLMRPLP